MSRTEGAKDKNKRKVYSNGVVKHHNQGAFSVSDSQKRNLEEDTKKAFDNLYDPTKHKIRYKKGARKLT